LSATELLRTESTFQRCKDYVGIAGLSRLTFALAIGFLVITVGLYGIVNGLGIEMPLKVDSHVHELTMRLTCSIRAYNRR